MSEPTPDAPVASDPEAPTVDQLDLSGLDDHSQKVVDAIRNDYKQERSRRQAAEARLKEAEPKLTEYDQLIEASKTDLERAQEAARTATESVSRFQARAVAAEVKALAADKFADPSDAAAFLELGKYAKPDGDIDTDAITTDLTDLLARKPHLGKVAAPAGPTGMRPNPVQGAGGSNPPLTVEAQIEAMKAAGDTAGAMRLKAAKALNSQG